MLHPRLSKIRTLGNGGRGGIPEEELRCSGVLWCYKDGDPRMEAPTEEQRAPTRKWGAGRPRVPQGEQSLERDSPGKGQGLKGTEMG